MIFILGLGASAVAAYWLAASTIFWWDIVLFDGEESKREAEIIPFPKQKR